MLNLGTIRPGSTVRIPFSTFDKDDGSSITMTGFAAADILVYKDGGTTERASTAGFTATTDFDGKTGKHLAVIDLADDTTADFWKAGSEYLVAIDAVTVDAITTGGWVARFQVGYAGGCLDTFIATLSSQTSFTLNSGPAEDDAINGHWAIVHDKASAVQRATVLILDYTGSTKTVTLAAAPTFAIAAGDNFSLMDLAPLQAATIGRTLAVDAAGLADANVVKAAGTAWNSGAIGAPTLAADTLTAAKVAADVTTELQSGLATASAVATLASYVDTEVAAIKVVTDKLNSTLESDGIGGYRLTTAAALNVWMVGLNDVDFPGGTAGQRLFWIDYGPISWLGTTLEEHPVWAGTYRFTRDAVDQIVADLLDVSSDGARQFTSYALANAPTGGGGDPWATALPGAYGAGSAGFIVGTYLDAAVSSALTAIDALPTNTELGTALAAADDATLAAIAAIAGSVGALPNANAIADAVLKRDWTAISGEASRSVLNALRWIRNGFWIDSDGVVHVLKEDDATTAYTRLAGTDPTADPISSIGAAP